MFLWLTSVSSPCSGSTIAKPLSFGNVVVTRKKISSRKAISAIDDVGTSLLAFDFLLLRTDISTPGFVN
jgi:hypothetical protein